MRTAVCLLAGGWLRRPCPGFLSSQAHSEKNRGAHSVPCRNVYEWRLIFGARNIVFGNDQQVRPPQLERYVERIIIHERYIPTLEINDIALLKITPPVQCGPYIGTGCLPHFKAGPPHVPQTCWVAGWGFLREDGEDLGAGGHFLGGLVEEADLKE